MRKWIRILLAAGLLVATGGNLPIAAQTAPHRAALGDRLAQRLDSADPSESIAIRVRLRSSDLPGPGRSGRRGALRGRQDRVLAALPSSGFRLKRRHLELAGFAGFADRAVIEALRVNPEVLSLHLDGKVYASLGQGVPLMGGDVPHALGYSGEGIHIAVVDTGIDTNHAHLSDDLVAEACFCDHSPLPGGCCPGGGATGSGAGSAEDDNGHGTSVSGIITSGFNSPNPGIAPNAGIVAVKALDVAGLGFDSDIDSALDWVFANRVTYAIKIVNMSLGDDTERNNPNSSACTSTPTADAIATLHAAGIPVFAAAGNEGFDNGIAAPACTPEAISVGGVYDANFGSLPWCLNGSCTLTCTDNPANADTFVCHSNSDEILDILAPDWKTRVAIKDGGTADFGGTSAASPYAAGAAALLLEADPTLTPEQIRTLLRSHGPMVSNPDNGLSFRRSDIAAALNAVAPCGDGNLQGVEECDDGNNLDGDCCSALCQFENNGSSCDDASACTTSDTCDGAGTCGGAPLACNDANACTDDSCDTGSGCVFANNTAPCDDGNACTAADTCGGGFCTPGGPISCDDSNACSDDSCNPGSGCVFANNADPCDDGNACTSADACAGGACTAGAPLACDDSNACTDDSCDIGSGCVFANNADPCDDADACTSPDTCAGGACASGPPLDCDDGDVCTADGCDGLSGCFHSAIPECIQPAEVPASTRWGHAALVALLGCAGALAFRPRRR